MSHDLRSALGGITGGLRLINAARLDGADRSQLDRVMRESVILGELLDIALQADLSPSADRAEGPCDIAEFLRQQSIRWKAQAEEKHVLWSLRLKLPLPAGISVSELRLTRAIGNVVNNAIKYTDFGAVELCAEINHTGALEISITDNGPGFSDEALSQVFQPYGRPDNSAKPGTGLGLHISKTLLEQIGATITIRNQQSVGARVLIVIPANLCLTAAESEPRLVRQQLPDLRGIRILLAEDNKTNQMVATQMLQSMNAEVTVASDGYEALLKFEDTHFDLALLDIEMPRISGLDVLRTIRARTDERAKTPLIALTAYAMREHKERIKAAGANGLIAKPLISIEAFGQALLGYLSIEGSEANNPAQGRSAPENTAKQALIDRDIYEALSTTIGPESMGELLDKVVEDVADVKAGLIEGAKHQDSQKIRSNTHILISVAGAIGATSLQSLAERLNAAAHGADQATLAELSDQCISGIQAAEGFLGQEQERFRLLR